MKCKGWVQYDLDVISTHKSSLTQMMVMPLLPHRVASSSLISLTKPIAPNTLKALRDLLKCPDPATPPTTLRSAAVLIPFCNVGGKPGILLEVRSKSLRTHSGEIRWETLCASRNNKLRWYLVFRVAA